MKTLKEIDDRINWLKKQEAIWTYVIENRDKIQDFSPSYNVQTRDRFKQQIQKWEQTRRITCLYFRLTEKLGKSNKDVHDIVDKIWYDVSNTMLIGNPDLFSLPRLQFYINKALKIPTLEKSEFILEASKITTVS